MSYRQSPAFLAALRLATVQRHAMRYRVGTLANVSGTPVVIRKRREVRS
jgi:hypothetical protein